MTWCWSRTTVGGMGKRSVGWRSIPRANTFIRDTRLTSIQQRWVSNEYELRSQVTNLLRTCPFISAARVLYSKSNMTGDLSFDSIKTKSRITALNTNVWLRSSLHAYTSDIQALVAAILTETCFSSFNLQSELDQNLLNLQHIQWYHIPCFYGKFDQLQAILVQKMIFQSEVIDECAKRKLSVIYQCEDV